MNKAPNGSVFLCLIFLLFSVRGEEEFCYRENVAIY